MLTSVALPSLKCVRYLKPRGTAPLRAWLPETRCRDGLHISSRTAFTFGVGTSLLCAIGIPPKLSSFVYCEAPSIEMKEAIISCLSEEDNERLVVAVDEALVRVLKWVDASDSWWDECKNIRMAPGISDARHKTKRIAGFESRIQVVSAVWDHASLRELELLSEASPNCLKLKFDPALATIQIKHTFGAGRKRLVRTNTKPVLLGLISGREVDSLVSEMRQLSDQRWVLGSVGLYSPYLESHVRGNPSLETLHRLPPSPGKVRAQDHTSGFVFEPLDAVAARGGHGRWRIHYLLCSEPGGGVPTWMGDKAVGKAIVDWFTSAAKELKTMHTSLA